MTPTVGFNDLPCAWKALAADRSLRKEVRHVASDPDRLILPEQATIRRTCAIYP